MMMRIFVSALIFFLAGSVANGQIKGMPMKFNFGTGKIPSGHTQVLATDVYSKEKGFGFEPGATVNCLARSGGNALRSDSCTSDKPFYFSAKVPEGNYKVTITFGNTEAATSTVVKAELRRLMLDKVETAKGRLAKREFIVNVRTPEISPGVEVKLKDREKNSEQWAWDEKLTLEFNGTMPSVSSIEIEKVDVPTIFLLGDSTVCDQPGEPYASWGQMITAFFGPNVAVANHAESGESLKSSFGAKRLDKVLSLMKRGDFLLIQYGHNDEKEKGEGVGAFTTYKASLKQFVAEARKKGGIPILVTPMHRRTFDTSGHITNSHGDYPEAVRQAAKEENVSVIDLTVMSKELYEALGKEGSGALFKEGDGTHHNSFGAYQLAKSIVQAIQDQKLGLGKLFLKGLPKFDPTKPDDPRLFNVPSSPAATTLKPLGS